MTETGLQRALDIQTQRAWESKEINATRQCELEIEIRELKGQCKQMKEKMSEDEEIYEMTAEDLKKQIDKKQIELEDPNWIMVADLRELEQQLKSYKEQAHVNEQERDKLDELISEKQHLHEKEMVQNKEQKDKL